MWVRLRSFVRALIRRDRFEDTLSEELRFHLDTYADNLFEKGIARKEAYRQARLHFGSVERVRDECRQARGLRLADELARDLRYGARTLRRRPLFTAVAVLSLGIGIGANTTVFGLVNALLLRTLPLERPAELVNLYMHTTSFRFSTLSLPDYEDVRDSTTGVFSQIGATRLTPVQIDGASGVDLVFAEMVTGSYFPMLGIQARLGRTILPEDDVSPGSHAVVMLSHAYWQRAFAGATDVLGQKLLVAGRAYEVIGVAPPDFPGSMPPVIPAFYAPYMMTEELVGEPVFDNRGNQSLFAVARLKPDVSLAQAETALTAVAADLTATYPDEWNRTDELAVVPTRDVLLYPAVDPFVRAAAWLLMVVVGLVLVLACTNLASFLLARALDRRRDVALRLALGASRGSLVRRLLIETTLLGLLAGVVGTAIGVGLLRVLQSTDLPLPVPVALDLTPDLNVLWFSLAISVLAGTLLGLVPAVQGTRADISSTLKNDTPGGGQPGHLRWRNGLVVAQLTVSLVLLVGAGLFLRSFQQAQAVDPGFGREPTALMTFMAPTTRFTEEEGRRHTQRVLDRVRQLPGVTSVGVTNLLHLTSYSTQSTDVNVDGVEPPADRGTFVANFCEVDPGFFDAAGIRILNGRNFTDGDQPDTQPVAIVSEAMARRFWPDGDAVGRLVRRQADDETDLLVVGVASDAKIRSLGEAPRLVFYLPYSQAYSPQLTVVAKTTADPERTALALISAGREIDPDLWVLEAKTMDDHLGAMLLPVQLSAFVVSIFGVLALALAIIGLYGVVSYAVAARTREVGLRMALGADAAAVVRLLATSGARLVMVGGAIGLALALLVTRLLGGLLFDIGTLDLTAFLIAPLVLGATALLAAYLPARRASRVNPVAALRVD